MTAGRPAGNCDAVGIAAEVAQAVGQKIDAGVDFGNDRVERRMGPAANSEKASFDRVCQ
jgi:hypothetical protein